MKKRSQLNPQPDADRSGSGSRTDDNTDHAAACDVFARLSPTLEGVVAGTESVAVQLPGYLPHGGSNLVNELTQTIGAHSIELSEIEKPGSGLDSLSKLSSGNIGTVKILSDGKLVLCIGNACFNISQADSSLCHSSGRLDLVSVDPHEQQVVFADSLKGLVVGTPLEFSST